MRARNASGDVDSHRNSFTRRGEPCAMSTRRPPQLARKVGGNARSHGRHDGAVCARV